MTENELAQIAVNIAFKIHYTLGPGLLESIYESAFCLELEREGIEYARQKPIDVYYGEELLDIGFRADIILEDKLIIELKSIEKIEKVHHKILLTYLKVTDLKLGLLINFNVELIKEGIFRKINGDL